MTYVERRAGLTTLAVGALLGAGITLALFGWLWWPLSGIGLGIALAVGYLASRGRLLDFEPWFVGVSGESQVRQALKELEPLGYSLIDDLDIGHGNVDHVLVGPTGIFAIETKNVGGRVRVAHGELVDPRDLQNARQAVRGAMWVRDRAAVRFVEALLVYPTAKVEGDVVRCGNVTVVSLPRLNAEIASRRRSLSPDEIRRATQALSADGRTALA